MNAKVKTTGLFLLFSLLCSYGFASEKLGYDTLKPITELVKIIPGEKPYEFSNFSLSIAEGADKQDFIDDKFIITKDGKESFAFDLNQQIQCTIQGSDFNQKKFKQSQDLSIYIDTVVFFFIYAN